MTTRLMLSLKRAAAEPKGTWTLSTMPVFVRKWPKVDQSVHFPLRTFEVPHGTETPTPPNEEDTEFKSMLVEPPRNGDSGQPC